MATSKGRRILREYAKSKGYDAKEFVKVEQGYYSADTLIFKDSQHKEGRCSIDYRDLFHFIVREGDKIFT